MSATVRSDIIINTGATVYGGIRTCKLHGTSAIPGMCYVVTVWWYPQDHWAVSNEHTGLRFIFLSHLPLHPYLTFILACNTALLVWSKCSNFSERLYTNKHIPPCTGSQNCKYKFLGERVRWVAVNYTSAKLFSTAFSWRAQLIMQNNHNNHQT